MKKKWLIGICALISIGVAAAVMFNEDNSISCRQSKEVSNLREVGIHLFAYANDRNGIYPDSINEILLGMKDSDLNDFIHDVRFAYHPPKVPVSELSKDDVILSYDFPGKGQVTHTGDLSTQYIKYKSEPGY